jgi:hypothetical protein
MGAVFVSDRFLEMLARDVKVIATGEHDTSHAGEPSDQRSVGHSGVFLALPHVLGVFFRLAITTVVEIAVHFTDALLFH